ncbi:catalase-like domain-containing protein [Diplogelasinospora grovesii]|uniref:Catalase-like domain-containing protein n=1 Tax=Diplogelasinospora grovesii TaxID=303347 RepID=A0AAN6S674_9PEZI|nr:catalase-like domain-containing protein [Diplogelasinospora grovesii]
MTTADPNLLQRCSIRLAQGSLRIGNQLQGVHLIRDINLLETISHVTHERIPERVVHAKGSGAYGTFTVANEANFNIADYTDADFLQQDARTTDLFARFSTVVGERGSADSVRDTRGYAFKLYTKDGNLDWVFFSTPTFPIRDGGKFPSFVHCQKRNPQTGVRDPTTGRTSFMSRNPEAFHTLMYIFSDAGTPRSYNYAMIHSVNTYKFTKIKPPQIGSNDVQEEFHYVKLRFIPKLGVQNLNQAEAERLAGQDPDAYQRDLIQSIAMGQGPGWTVQAQIIDPKDVANYPVNIFDPTKTWPESVTPFRTFGSIDLNSIPDDFFEQVEQASFNPANVVPGWDVSPDPNTNFTYQQKVLQTRLFAYGSAARYRLGINNQQLPVNSARKNASPYNPTKRDGAGYVNSLLPRVQPNYFPAQGAPPRVLPQDVNIAAADLDQWSGGVIAYKSTVVDDDYTQPREVWESYKAAGTDETFVENVAMSLKNADFDVRQQTYGKFSWVRDFLHE